MAVQTYPGQLLVSVSGRVIEGWISEDRCPDCQEAAVYFLAFDATFCAKCNRWLKFLCESPECVHCRCRPEKPIAA